MSFGGPKTIEEAKPYRYGTWAGNPKGNAYRPDRCLVEVSSASGWIFCQCSRKCGPDGYCTQHRKKKDRP